MSRVTLTIMLCVTVT